MFKEPGMPDNENILSRLERLPEIVQIIETKHDLEEIQQEVDTLAEYGKENKYIKKID